MPRALPLMMRITSNVTLAVADKFLNTGLGDFSDQALSALGVTPDQLQVVGSVVKESKDAKQVKKKAEHDPKLWCVTCGPHRTSEGDCSLRYLLGVPVIHFVRLI